MSNAQPDTEEDEEEEEDIGVSWSSGSQGPNREDMVASYLPEQDDWLAKTVLEMNDPGRVAALKQFGTLFPEVEDLDPVIEEFLHDLLRGQTSIAGSSRNEFQRIFESMYGGHPESDDTGSMLAEALGANVDED